VVFGEAGEAPPIFAQAANSNLVYIANQPAAPKAEALIVQKDSKIQSIQDLKGKRIALNKGSNVHYLLLKVLEANNLKLSDIEAVYLPHQMHVLRLNVVQSMHGSFGIPSLRPLNTKSQHV
jgi:sulfonate transport system substrate-binding protein